MKKLESLGKSLTRSEQKKIIGGTVDPGGDAGCTSTCTYTSGNRTYIYGCNKISYQGVERCYCSNTNGGACS